MATREDSIIPTSSSPWAITWQYTHYVNFWMNFLTFRLFRPQHNKALKSKFIKYKYQYVYKCLANLIWFSYSFFALFFYKFVLLWNNTHGGLVDRSVIVEQRITIKKKLQRVEGRKEKNTDLRTAKRKVEFLTLFTLCEFVCVWLSQVHCETPNNYQKCWLISGYRLYHSTSGFSLHFPLRLLCVFLRRRRLNLLLVSSTPALRVDWPAPWRRLECETFNGRNPIPDLTNVLRPYFRSRSITRPHLFVWSSR